MSQIGHLIYLVAGVGWKVKCQQHMEKTKI